MTQANKQPRRRQPQDIRQIIRRRLKEIGRNPHWLSEQQRVVTPQTVRTYLYGGRQPKDTTGRVLAELFAIIGLDVAAIEQSPAAIEQSQEGN